MKKICECIEEWSDHLCVFPINNPNNFRIVEMQEVPYREKCLKCGYNYWYDADYENMMYDLKRMND